MEFQIGDLVATPNGNGYINDIIEDDLIIDLVDGDQKRETFHKEAVTLLTE
ncbi:hypothetical protein [Mucilaginibacter lacusdianchii]|uniref:hypothetical protein n=1 Tax=Mucilaginibacter lacusdianchii TaxID=2684211 RepID=UPI00131B99CF|nr:hypothetical protein [Mucilaginibacter sp. JXJ CY 39]